jgi:hypothetical protein
MTGTIFIVVLTDKILSLELYADSADICDEELTTEVSLFTRSTVT